MKTYTGIALSEDEVSTILAQLDTAADRYKAKADRETKDLWWQEKMLEQYKKVSEARDRLKEECTDSIRRWRFTCEIKSGAEF